MLSSIALAKQYAWYYRWNLAALAGTKGLPQAYQKVRKRFRGSKHMNSFFSEVVHVDDLPADDPIKLLGNNVADLFTHMVELMRNNDSFPNYEINQLMNLTWWLVNQKRVHTAIHEGVQYMHFGANADCTLGMFAIPPDWADQCLKRRVFCAGGLVWASSHCRDFYNSRTALKDPTVIRRAMAYESEYYLSIHKKENFQPNEYQQKVIKEFPKGLESARSILYPRKEFMGRAS